MITLMKRVSEVASEVLAAIGGFAVGVMVLLVTYSSISRYFFGRAVNYMNEVAGLLMMVVCFLSFPYVFMKGGHIRVALILNKLSSKARGYLELGNRIVLSLYLMVFTKIAYDFVADSYRYDCHTPDSNLYEVPWMSVMPVSGLVFCLIAIMSCVEPIWNIITGRKKGLEAEKAQGPIEEETKSF
jgi:TRAP-type C4-dicarboxylate transport system permease small subunit